MMRQNHSCRAKPHRPFSNPSWQAIALAWGVRGTRRLRAAAESGFTAVELMITLAILAILTMIAAPSMSQFLEQWSLSNSVNAFNGTLKMARAEAIARSKRVVVCRVASDTSTTCVANTASAGFETGWMAFVDNDNSSANSSPSFYTNGDEILVRQGKQPRIQQIGLKSNNLGAGGFIFLPNGLLNNAANSLNFDAKSFTSTSATGWARKGMCISKPGRIYFVNDNVDCS